MQPLQLQSVRATLRSPLRLKTEALAGLVVALALIPEAIAFSVIAGVDPRIGLFASFTMAVVMIFVSAITFEWHSIAPRTLRRIPKSETTVGGGAGCDGHVRPPSGPLCDRGSARRAIAGSPGNNRPALMTYRSNRGH
jgi:hypothetical protein